MQVTAVAAAGPGRDAAQAAMRDLSFGMSRLAVGGACCRLAELAVLMAWRCRQPTYRCPGTSRPTLRLPVALCSAVLLLDHAAWSGAFRHVLLATEWCHQVKVPCVPVRAPHLLAPASVRRLALCHLLTRRSCLHPACRCCYWSSPPRGLHSFCRARTGQSSPTNLQQTARHRRWRRRAHSSRWPGCWRGLAQTWHSPGPSTRG